MEMDEYSSASESDTIVVAPSHGPSRQTSTVTLGNGRVESQRKSRTGKGKGFRYEKDNVEVLYLLRTKYRGSWQHTENVFNAVFQAQIEEQGLDRGPKGSALASRFTKRLHEDTPLWEAFLGKTLSDRNTSAMLERRIKQALQTVVSVPLPMSTGKSTSKLKPKFSKVSREEAHPPIPSVLFRAYCDKSQGLNTPRGFLAAHFQDDKELPLPPLYSDPAMFGVTKRHLNMDKFESPFVSTCNSLLRTIRRSLKDRDRADLMSCRISIIDGLQASEGDRIFHTPPYHRQVMEAKAFTNGRWMYKGIDEYLVWAGIPGEAIIHDFALGELLEFCAGDEVVMRAVGTDDPVHTTWEKLHRLLAAKQNVLSCELIAGIARLVSFLGGRITTPPAVIARLVSEVLHGWCIKVEPQDLEAWIADAAVFARTLSHCQVFRPAEDAVHFRALCEAFVAGIRTSVRARGSHFETDPGQVRSMTRKAIGLGLLAQPEDVLRRVEP